MRDMNEDAAVGAAQRATAEAIEGVGDQGPSVTDLLSMLTPTPPPTPAQAASPGLAAAEPGCAVTADTTPPRPAPSPTAPAAGPVAPASPGPAAAEAAVPASPAADGVPAAERAPVPGRGKASGAGGSDASIAPVPDVRGLALAIADAAGRHLPKGRLDLDADFFDAGGGSVHAVELAAELERDLGVELSLDDVFADARPLSLARRWLAATGLTTGTVPETSGEAAAPSGAGTPAVAVVPRGAQPVTTLALPDFPPSGEPPHSRARQEDLEQILADLALADRLPFVRSPEPLPPRRILLTGATGFLGGHLLLDLLRHSDAHVHCLVRGADEASAAARLGESLRGYRLPWNSEIRRRVTVVPGDLREPRLGLSEEQWLTLARELDSVVGVAAAVDFLRGYRSLRSGNVLGTLTLAELAATGRPKPLHHISSIAVFNEVGITSMGEDDPFAHVDGLVAGYDQSKWAAETALRRARDHGLVVSALRPGGIGGHSRTGAYNPQDLSSGLISAFGRFRTVPAFRHLNVAPVDWVSRVAAAVVCEPDAWGFDYHLTGVPGTLDDVVRDMASGGMHVRVQDWDAWRADVLARLEAEPVPELGFLTRVLRSPTALKLCEATLGGPAAVAARTDALVEALGLPPAARYDARAQLRTFEKLAEDGLGRLPGKGDQPYLWFAETAEGSVRALDGGTDDTPCALSLTLSVASMHQLVEERRIDVTGEVVCPAIHGRPLTVVSGDVWVRPDEGIPRHHGLKHQLLRYRIALSDEDDELWWLEGHKHARARRDLWHQTRALTIEAGREGGPAVLAGEVVVPADSYVRDQIDGIKVAPHLTAGEKRAAKLTWLAWFGLEMGRGLLGPFARAAADLLDLRRTPNLTEQHR